jgi:hypothetical protein
MIESEQPETVGAVTDATDAPVHEENAGEFPAEKMALLTRMDFALLLLPLATFALWLFSLEGLSFRHMNDLGLVSVFSPVTIIALVIMMLSFCANVQRPQLRTPVLLLHVLLLIFMLYGVTTLVEEAPRFGVLYRHAGYAEYIMRTGSVNPDLDAYFNWPGFFILSAFVTRITGYPSIFSFATWSPVFLNVIYLGPLFMILTSTTSNKRLVWLALWFFYLTNWIAQDYYSPQGLDFFFYLVIFAILLRWFRVPAGADTHKRAVHFLRYIPSFVQRLYGWFAAPDAGIEPASNLEPAMRWALLVLLLIVFAFVVFSHPLTPFFVLVSVTALVFFRRCGPVWLPLLMAIMTAVWILVMATTFLEGHLYWVTGGIGQIASAFTSNVASRVTGSPEHSLITKLRLLMTAVIWGLALAGCIRRALQGHRDVNAILLAIMPFPLLILQPYGGEMLLRIYLFSLPPVVFFAASLFYSRGEVYPRPVVHPRSSLVARASRNLFIRFQHVLISPRWTTALIRVLSIALLVGFLFTRYGNERQDYMTYAEVTGVRHLYDIAHPGSIFIAGTDGTPWQFQDFEKYNTFSLTDSLLKAIANRDVNAIAQFAGNNKHTYAYLIFTRSQEATLESSFGLPPDTLSRLEKALIASGQFTMLYSNPDAQILLFIEGPTGGAP